MQPTSPSPARLAFTVSRLAHGFRRLTRCCPGLALAAVAALLAAPAAFGQVEIKARISNFISYRPEPTPIGPAGQPTGEPTITPQFAGAVFSSFSAGPIAAQSALTDRYPTSGAIVLQRASAGGSFATGVPRYFLGDTITTPSSYTDASGDTVSIAASFWRGEPIRAGEIVVNPSGQPLVDSTGAPITLTGGVIVPALASGVYEHFYYSPHAKRVLASEPGQVTVWWRSNVPDANQNYILVREIFSVSSATTSPVRTIFWTEKSFNGPRVQISGSRIETVNPVFSNVFPKTVTTEFAPVGGPISPDVNPQVKTLWFEKTNGNGEIHAYNVTGRILIEYLGAPQPDGSHQFLGADIVEVSRAATAVTLPIKLGEEIRPDPEDRRLVASPVTNTTSGSTNYYGNVTRPDGSLAFYAEHENYVEDQVVFYWLEQFDAGVPPSPGTAAGLKLAWPKFLNKYQLVWPDKVTDFAHYTVATDGSSTATGTGLQFIDGKIPTLVYQDDPEQDEAVLESSTQRLFVALGGDQVNRTLLKFTGDNGGIWYLRLMTQASGHADFAEGDDGPPLSATVNVGDRITPPLGNYSPAGYIASGTDYDPTAYRDPFSVGIASAESGAIIPVNAQPDGASQLEVWWFQRIDPPSAEFATVYTPAKIGRYTVVYDPSDPTIVLASNLGTGDLPPDQANGMIYVQNDPTQTGYNPNEEHALMLSGRAYALRDDLNITSGAGFTSHPRVLIRYNNSTDNRPAIAPYIVRREDDTYAFDYGVTAGTILNSPMPLPFLPLPINPASGLTRNTEVPSGPPEAYADGAPDTYAKFTFKDRKGYDWVYRGPHAAESPQLGMQWYYTMRDGYYIPGLATQPAEGTILPYLRASDGQGGWVGDPVSATPLTVVYRPVWPTGVPTMSVGETLSLPNHGLPAVRGNSSAVVFYEQSIAQQGPDTASVTLHDATRAKSILLDDAQVGLTHLPASAALTSQNGKTYFQLLPPHLQQRFYFDPTLGPVGGLALVGQFVDEIAGEDYLLLNTLSVDDLVSLKEVVSIDDTDYKKWTDAINNLGTKVETFMEDPAKRGTYIPDASRTVTVGGTDLVAITDSNTAVDSYALTATGAGSGYVTLLFGNGTAFTPVGEPVSVAIIKIAPQLYTGDLKSLPASNPLDEQSTLRHSGDFAAHPDRYEFEWRYAPPNNGVVPPIYTYSMKTVLGTTADTPWLVAANPNAPLPSDYPATSLSFPRSLAVNSSGYDAASGQPGSVLKSASNVHFDAPVPSDIVFSTELGTHDGFVLYINGNPVLASRLPVGIAPPGKVVSSDARTGLSTLGLTYQFSVPSTYFVAGDNSIEVALYSTADINAASSLDFRLDASVELDRVAASGSPWIKPDGTLSNVVVVGGSATSPLGNPLLVFSDNYFTVRYRPQKGVDTVAGPDWSRWMTPKLVESWIKRALDGINPFTQRTDDLFNNPVSTDVSILTQAGKRWEGDVALNLNNINDFGLIEIYETLLNRAKKLSIDAGSDLPGTNDTLLLVAGYLNDLYMTLGNEASDDADNPTIAIDGNIETSAVSTARFSFESQVPSLIDEELTLLRGRDDFLSPSVTVSPAYNRLYWNYTNGINAGESIYALNYDIQEKSDGPYADGTLDASDAQYLYPQGHGDAYGHYLTALTGYYKLLTSPNFTWTPRTESVDVLGQTVQVDYQDERKFAAAAAAVARTGARIMDVTARDLYRDDPSVGWSHQRDRDTYGNTGKLNGTTGRRRAWGTDEWAARAGQGAYFNWIVANAMLPDVAPTSVVTQNSDGTTTTTILSGIQLIDRSTVPEIAEIVSSAIQIQDTLDDQCAHVNPLRLANGAIAFDISPTELKAGKSHFEQVYTRALQAALNAKAAFDRASVMNRTLRNQNNSLSDYNNAVSDQERAYQYQLTTLFGQPYAGDIGPGKLYEQGYTGPDLYHYWLINRPSTVVDTSTDILVTLHEPMNLDPFKQWSVENVHNKLNDPVQYTDRTFTFSAQSMVQFAPSDLGSRSQPGALQRALLDVYQADVGVRQVLDELRAVQGQFERDYQLVSEFETGHQEALDTENSLGALSGAASAASGVFSAVAAYLDAQAEFVQKLYIALAEFSPRVSGIDNDVTSSLRGAEELAGIFNEQPMKWGSISAKVTAVGLNATAGSLSATASKVLRDYNWSVEDRQHIYEFEQLLEKVIALKFAIADRLAGLQRASEQVSEILAEADHILSEREIFRQRAAAIIQGYRTRDLTYRTFRNEELAQYQALYDLAAQYTYLTTQSYDYETGLLGTSAGQAVIDSIVSTRSLGDFKNGAPTATTSSTRGDGGLANVLARLQSDWSAVKTRLGINNPDANGTLFSLRQELFRVRTDAATAEDDKAWQQVLEQHIMSNVLNDPDVALYANNLRKTNGTSVPGIVISFSTTIEQGLNFFGRTLAAGDHTFTHSNFATKIYATGIVLDGYVGMDPYAIGTPNAGKPASSAPNALSATPYVYLIPAGVDSMLAPSLGDTGVVRSWQVRDQAMPLPFNLGESDFAEHEFFTPQDTVNEQFWIARKHPAFRPVNDPAFFYSSQPAEFTNTRLVGRSVWNSRWKLVIPAYTLLNDEQGGLDRFVRSVADIRLFLRTYSHSGN